MEIKNLIGMRIKLLLKIKKLPGGCFE